MWMDTCTIKNLKTGRILDGHVHDVLGFGEVEEPWPYSTDPRAQVRLQDWLKRNKAQVSLAGVRRWRFVEIAGFKDSFTASSESHALCLAVLLSDYLMKYGRHKPMGNFR